jgi:hypothetical protein
MSEPEQPADLRDFVSDRGEQLLGRVTREVLDSPVLGGVLGRLLGARARATQAQEAAIGILGVPSAADVERLTRRVRSLSDRLGGIEDSLTRIEGAVRRQGDQLNRRLDALEKELGGVTRTLADLEAARPEEPVAVSRDQEVLLRATSGG